VTPVAAHQTGATARKRECLDESGITALVAAFYSRARADDMIGPVFAAVVPDWDAHLARLVDFWSSVMLTTGRYKGNPFAAHRSLPIRGEMFDRWLALWRTTADELFETGPAQQLTEKAERIAASLSDGLLFPACLNSSRPVQSRREGRPFSSE
jgi:hemoglobin